MAKRVTGRRTTTRAKGKTPRAAAAIAAPAAAAPLPLDLLTGFLGDGRSGSLTAPVGGMEAQCVDFTVPLGVTQTTQSGSTLRCRGTFHVAGTVTVDPGLLPPRFFKPETTQYSPNPGVAILPPTGGVVDGPGVAAVGGAGGRTMGTTARFIVRVTGQEAGPGITASGPSVQESKGGGSLVVRANRIVIDGTIRADGGAAQSAGSSGGAGGVVVLAAREEIVIKGFVRARGGAGAAASAIRGGGGGGGGGIIHLIAPVITIIAPRGERLDVAPGAGGTYFNDASRYSGCGGHGGGACGGNGGAGGGIKDRLARAGEPGVIGQVFQNNSDPVGNFG